MVQVKLSVMKVVLVLCTVMVNSNLHTLPSLQFAEPQPEKGKWKELEHQYCQYLCPSEDGRKEEENVEKRNVEKKEEAPYESLFLLSAGARNEPQEVDACCRLTPCLSIS